MTAPEHITFRRQALANGYEPIPVAGKAPPYKGWNAGEITAERLGEIEAAHPECENTGLRTGRLVGVDIDLTNAAHAMEIQKVVAAHLSETPLHRVGSKGVMLAYHNETPIPKITIGTKKSRLVEILGTGQHFVAHGIHPDTGKPYEWPNDYIGGDPTQTALADLPAVTAAMLHEMANAIAARLTALGYGDVAVTGIKSAPENADAPEASGRPISAAQIEDMLRCINPAIDRGAWLTVCGGLVNAPVSDAGWNGLDVFTRWSAGELHDGPPANFKGAEDCEAQWARDVEGQDAPAFGALVNLAREGGYDGPSFSIPPVCERISAIALDKLLADSELAQGEPLREATGVWTFGVHDAEADARLPPITYRDALKLWPDSPGKTVSQVIAGPKQHKTNWIMAELFRLMLNASAKVLMLALEGGYGVRTMRLKALAAFYNIPLADLRGRFQVVQITAGGMFDMSNPECVTAFAAFVKAGGWTDVFIDTQHRSAGALEENSATDARVFWNAVEILRRRGDVNVTLAHHTGKDATKGGRGSSADLASVDQQIELAFDRLNMTVIAKVTARKDGADGFSVPFKVEQASENAVPILVPMTAQEFQAIADSEDRTAPREVSAALQRMERVGKEKGCTSRVLAVEVLSLHGELPGDGDQQDKTIKNLVNRLQARAQKDARLQAYGRKDGAGRTAPWLWYLPTEEREVWPHA